MDEQRRGPRDLPTSERIATLAGATTNAMGHKASGEHATQHGATLSVPLAEAERIIASLARRPTAGRPADAGAVRAAERGDYMAGTAVRQALGKVKDAITGPEHAPTER
jgi:hypothetical protein